MVISLIGVLVAFVVFIWLVVKKEWSMLTGSVVAALIVMIFDRMNLWTGFSTMYNAGVSAGVGGYFLLFALGSLFGHMMSKSGCAVVIANYLIKIFGKKRFVLALYIVSALMVYGGISILVVVFTTGPIGLAVCKEVNMPRRFLFAILIAGSGSFAMTSIPGTPSVTNLIPCNYLGTPATAAPVLGIIATIIIGVLNYLYLAYMEKHYRKINMGFEDTGEGTANKVLTAEDFGELGLPSIGIAIVPVLILICFILFLSKYVGGSTAAAVFGDACAIAFCYIVNMKRISGSLGSNVVAGAQGGIMAACNMGSVVGFGVVIKNSQAFQLITNFCDSMAQTRGTAGTLFALFVSVSIFVAFCAAASSGEEMFWATLGDRFVASGINPQVLHRMSSIAAGGFDTMPHNSVFPTFNVALGTKFGDTYLHALVTCTIVPVIAALICIPIAAAGVV